MKQNDIITTNDDLLKVENLDKNEYIVTASIVDAPVIKQEKKQRKITLFSTVLAALSLKMADDEIYSKIRPIKTLKFLLLSTILTVVLYLLYQVADLKIILPAVVIFCSTVVPGLAMSLVYEIAPKKIITIFQVLCSFLFGLILYLAINALSNAVLIRTIYKTTIDTILVPIFWGIGELLFITILSKIYNINDLSAGIILAVSVGMGYSFASGIHHVVSSLFVPVEVIINESEHYVGAGIIDSLKLIQKATPTIINNIVWHCIYYPLLMACWSVVIGNVFSVSGIAKADRRDNPFSVYLLLVLVIVMYILSVTTVSFETFDLMLKLVVATASVIFAVLVLNTSLTRAFSPENE